MWNLKGQHGKINPFIQSELHNSKMSKSMKELNNFNLPDLLRKTMNC